MLKYTDLKKRKREFLAMTGLTLKEFKLVLPAFTQAYERLLEREQKQKRPKRKGNPGAGRPEKLIGPEQKLLFILVYLKTYTLQVILGQLFDMSQGTANTWVQRLLPVLREALDELGYLPEREGPELAATQRGRRGTREYVIDGTERRRQRPKDAEKQAIHYSGKKRLHTDKNIVVCQTGTQRVVYLSPTYPGTVHDKKLADHEQISYPKSAVLHKDTGFQGYEPDVQQTHPPKKKSKGQELTPGERRHNRKLSRVRIVVEHAISGIKRNRSVKDTLRNTLEGISDVFVELATALHNLRIDRRLYALRR